MSKAYVEVAILAHRRLRRHTPTLTVAAPGAGTEVSDTTIPPAPSELGSARGLEPREDND